MRTRCVIYSLFIACLGILTSGIGSAQAQALHAVLLRSDPAERSVLTVAPQMIRLTFSEAVQPIEEAISVRGPTGTTIKHSALQVSGTELRLPITITQSGSYLVSWQVISQDTAPVSGSFVFSLRQVSGVWANSSGGGVSQEGLWLQVLAHWLHFIGYALGFGALAFQQWVLRPCGLAKDSGVEQRIARLVTTGLVMLLCAEPLALIAQTASLGNSNLFDIDLIGAVLASGFGLVLAQRFGAAILLWILTGIFKEGYAGAYKAGLALGLVLAFVDATVSHNTGGPAWLTISATTLHIAAMGVWLGGLGTLIALWPRKEINHHRSMILSLFGRLAATALAEIIISGLIMSWSQLIRPASLLLSAYGQVLALKIALALIALPLIFIGTRVNPLKKPGWWVREALLLGVVLLLASLLVSLPPPQS